MNKPQTPKKTLSPEIRTLHWLKATFPQCFMKGEVKQPLKIGIHQDVLAYCQEHYPEQSRVRLRKAVAVYAKGTQYLACLKAGHARVDLQGNPCDVVTEEQQAHAEEILKERLERVDKPKEQKSFFKKDALPPKE